MGTSSRDFDVALRDARTFKYDSGCAAARGRMVTARIEMALILLVDDDESTLEGWRAALSLTHEVITACNGIDAWERLQTQTVDAVVADLRMPRMSGGVLCEKIREHARMGAMPVVLVSGELSPPAFVRYDSYLRKPLDPRQLQETIERLLSQGSSLRRTL